MARRFIERERELDRDGLFDDFVEAEHDFDIDDLDEESLAEEFERYVEERNEDARYWDMYSRYDEWL